MAKLKEFFAAHGDKVGLLGSVFFALGAFFFSGAVAPALDAERQAIHDTQGRIARELARAFTPAPDEPQPADPALIDRVSAVRRLAFPSVGDLHVLISRGGAGQRYDVALMETGEKSRLEKDYTDEVREDEVGFVKFHLPPGAENYVKCTKLSATRVLFEVIKELPPKQVKTWEAEYEIIRQAGQTPAAHGKITVEKVQQQPRLRALPDWAGDPVADPLDLGKTALTWKPASVQFQQATTPPVRYLVERCEGDPKSGRFELLTPVPIDECRFVDPGAGILLGREYHYRVRSVVPPAVQSFNFTDRDKAWNGRFGQDAVTLPIQAKSVLVPTGTLFRYYAMQTVPQKTAVIEFWLFDPKRRIWEKYPNEKLEEGNPLDVKTGDRLLQATEFKIEGIFAEQASAGQPHEPSKIFALKLNPQIRLSLEMGKVYRILRDRVTSAADCVVYEGKPPEAGSIDRPPPPSEPAVDLKPLEDKLADGKKLIPEKKFAEARAILDPLKNEAVEARKPLQSEDNKKRMDNFIKKVDDALADLGKREKGPPPRKPPKGGEKPGDGPW